MQFSYQTDKGQIREINQDQAIVYENKASQILALVCDGMGGHRAGDIASKIACEYILDCFKIMPPFLDVDATKQWMQDTIESCNRLVLKTAKTNAIYEGMGTTIIMVVVLEKQFLMANIGDSRLYTYHRHQWLQLSEDQTLVQQLVVEGAITKEEAKHHSKRHVLLQAIGVFENLKYEIKEYPLEEGYLLLCSDGLYTALEDQKIMAILDTDMSIEEKVHQLVSEANRQGGHDNIAVALLKSEGEGQ